MGKFASSLYSFVKYDGKLIFIEPLLEKKQKFFIIEIICGVPFSNRSNLAKYQRKYEHMDDVLNFYENYFHDIIEKFDKNNYQMKIWNYKYEVMEVFIWKRFFKIYREISGKEFEKKNFHIRNTMCYNSSYFIRFFCDNLKDVIDIVRTTKKLSDSMLPVVETFKKLIADFQSKYDVEFFFVKHFLHKFAIEIKRIYLPLHSTYLTEDGFQIVYSKNKHGKYVIVNNNGKFRKLSYTDKNTFRIIMGNKIVRKVANMPISLSARNYYWQNVRNLKRHIHV